MEYPASYTAASYWAELPNPLNLHAVTDSGGIEHVRGMFGFKFRDVFAGYYKNSNQKGIETAPHVVFARCGDDAGSILNFTRDWGPLHHPASEPPISGKLKDELFTKGELAERHRLFSFTLFWWRNVQAQFRNAIEELGEPNKSKLPVGGSIRIPVPTSTLDLRIVRAARDAVAPQMVAGSLIEAFWLMLWLDSTQQGRRIRLCANERCRVAFLADRSDKIFHDERCAQRVAKRRHWAKKGSKKRRAARNTNKRKKA